MYLTEQLRRPVQPVLVLACLVTAGLAPAPAGGGHETVHTGRTAAAALSTGSEALAGGRGAVTAPGYKTPALARDAGESSHEEDRTHRSQYLRYAEQAERLASIYEAHARAVEDERDRRAILDAVDYFRIEAARYRVYHTE